MNLETYRGYQIHYNNDMAIVLYCHSQVPVYNIDGLTPLDCAKRTIDELLLIGSEVGIPVDYLNYRCHTET